MISQHGLVALACGVSWARQIHGAENAERTGEGRSQGKLDDGGQGWPPECFTWNRTLHPSVSSTCSYIAKCISGAKRGILRGPRLSGKDQHQSIGPDQAKAQAEPFLGGKCRARRGNVEAALDPDRRHVLLKISALPS